MIQVNRQIDSAQTKAAPGAGHAPTLRIIDELAGRIQTQAEQLNELMAVCLEAAHDTAAGGESERKRASLRLETFLVLAQSLARETADAGNAIEKLTASTCLAVA